MYAGVPITDPVRVRTELTFDPCWPELRDAEVEHLDHLQRRIAIVGDQVEIVGLEIAVDDPGGVRGGERAGGLRGDAPRLGVAHAPDAPEPRGEVLALEQLHHDVRDARRQRPAVEHLDDAGVTDRVRGARLVEEALEDLGVVGQAGRRIFTAARRPIAGCSAGRRHPCRPHR
jgi:hypothetical protein